MRTPEIDARLPWRAVLLIWGGAAAAAGLILSPAGDYLVFALMLAGLVVLGLMGLFMLFAIPVGVWLALFTDRKDQP